MICIFNVIKEGINSLLSFFLNFEAEKIFSMLEALKGWKMLPFKEKN